MRQVTVAFLFLISLTPVVGAQSTNATLTGRLTDSTKAVIADAKIAAISDSTNIRYETTNGLIACELAAQGLGVALSDLFVAISSGATDLLIRPLDEEILLEYGFLYPIGKTKSTAVSMFAEAVRATVMERLTKLSLPEDAFTLL